MNNKIHQRIKVRATVEKKITVCTQTGLSALPDIPPRGRIIWPPRIFFLTTAAAYNLIDRGRKSYNIIHGRGEQQLEGQTPRICKGKINPRVRKIPASITKTA
jgi:hypothetical protein